MDKNKQQQPAGTAIFDLFNRYLGRSIIQKPDDPTRSPMNKKERVTDFNRKPPPPIEQFLVDFQQLWSQYPEEEQLRSMTESVLIYFIIHWSSQAPREEFLLFSLRSLCSIGYIKWDTFLQSLLSSVEMSTWQGMLPSSSTIYMVQGVGPAQTENDTRSVCQLCCKIILAGLMSNLKPVTHVDIWNRVMNWLVIWASRQQGPDDVSDARVWIHSCLEIIWQLVEDDKCRVPFYELLRSDLQLHENIPDDDSLFTLILEIHRRRNMIATHMQMSDQHLQCPTFAIPRFQLQVSTNLSPLTYPSVMGEPLHGEELAVSIKRGTLDWDRALRYLRHALRSSPSAHWWTRPILPYHRAHVQVDISCAVFTYEMFCEAIIDRIVELLTLTNSEINCWQEWLIFADTFYFLIRDGNIDFVDFVDKLVLRLAENEKGILHSNHVAWLLVQIIKLEVVTNALNTDLRKVETTAKILSFYKEDMTADYNSPQNILIDITSSCLNLQTRDFVNNEPLHKIKQIEEWWWKTNNGEHMSDYMNLDNRSVVMFWVLSYTMEQTAYDTVISWFTSAGISALLPSPRWPVGASMMVMLEVIPPPMALLSGLSINLCMKLETHLKDYMFCQQAIPSTAVVETYARLLILMPNSLFIPDLLPTTNNNFKRGDALILALEILNYRLLPLYRYNGKSIVLLYTITEIVSKMKEKFGTHRIFRLAENLCMNLIMSIREFFFVKQELKGPTEFTETLNRIIITSLAIIIKTRGIAEQEQLHYLPTMLEQILTKSQHTWSEKTLRHFPSILHETLSGRLDKRDMSIQAWKQVETTVINQCKQLLSPSADLTYVVRYIRGSVAENREHLCAGAWVLMDGHPEIINNPILAQVLRLITPDEVTKNIYAMVDILLHHMQLELQHGHLLQEVLLKTSNNLAYFVWNSELFPLDILLLALIDRDDDPRALLIVISLLERSELQQRIEFYIINCGPSEHWLYSGTYNRIEVQQALGYHLSWMASRHVPTFFDSIAARMFPVLPLIIYRLIENDATDSADRILELYSTFLRYYPFNFTFVRDILAYFYGHLPTKLVLRFLKILDPKKIPFSESFSQHLFNAYICPPRDYFATLLLGLVNNVIPSLNNILKSGFTGYTSSYVVHAINNKISSTHGYEGQKPFYQIQDPGTNSQLVLDTAVIEIMSLPVPTSQIVSALVQIVVHIQTILIQSNNGLHTDSMSAEGSATPSVFTSFVSRSGCTCQQLSTLIIQAGGLLLAQLLPEFHVQLYSEVSCLIKESWWLTDDKWSLGKLDCAVSYALIDPTCGSRDSTSTTIGNLVALLHAFFYNLPHEWLKGSHLIIKHLRPVTSIAMLRIVFRIVSPLLPRMINSHALFDKTLSLLLGVLVDVFGKNTSRSTRIEASNITDITDFLHHIIHYEGQSGPVGANSKPRLEVLTLFERALKRLRPDVQLVLSHLTTDANSSIYAATHPSIVQQTLNQWSNW